MKKLALLLLSAILLYNPAGAQFQNSTLPETMIPGSNVGGHIHRVTNYSYGGLDFSDFSSDLYVATCINPNNTNSFYYKRTEANNATHILDEGFASIPNSAAIYDAVILYSYNNVSGTHKPYGVAVIYKGFLGGASIAFFEWNVVGLNLIADYQFTTLNVRDMRMDANELYYYTVVFDADNALYSFGGGMPLNPAGYPAVGTVKELKDANPNYNQCFRPDVAMTKLMNPPAGMNTTGLKLYYAYNAVDVQPNPPDYIQVEVSYLSFDELMTSPLSSLSMIHEHEMDPGANWNIIDQQSGYSYGPLIDAPDISEDSWSAIMDWYGDSLGMKRLKILTSHKINENLIGKHVHDTCLNDGKFYPSPLSQQLNMSEEDLKQGKNLYFTCPTVAFSPDGNRINYAWGVTQDNPLIPSNYAVNGYYYLGVLYEPDPTGLTRGEPVITPNGEIYRTIDYDLTLVPYFRLISFSGQNTTLNNLYTVFASDLSFSLPFDERMYQKHPMWVTIENQGYRPAGVNEVNINELGIIVHPNPYTDDFSLSFKNPLNNAGELLFKISDLRGAAIFQTRGDDLQKINRSIKENLKNYSTASGIYLITLEQIETGQKSVLKIIKR